ncbi:MAG: hypothetical protein ABIE74_06825 [Pseudomonadota bacterium]
MGTQIPKKTSLKTKHQNTKFNQLSIKLPFKKQKIYKANDKSFIIPKFRTASPFDPFATQPGRQDPNWGFTLSKPNVVLTYAFRKNLDSSTLAKFKNVEAKVIDELIDTSKTPNISTLKKMFDLALKSTSIAHYVKQTEKVTDQLAKAQIEFAKLQKIRDKIYKLGKGPNQLLRPLLPQIIPSSPANFKGGLEKAKLKIQTLVKTLERYKALRIDAIRTAYEMISKNISLPPFHQFINSKAKFKNPLPHQSKLLVHWASSLLKVKEYDYARYTYITASKLTNSPFERHVLKLRAIQIATSTFRPSNARWLSEQINRIQSELITSQIKNFSGKNRISRKNAQIAYLIAEETKFDARILALREKRTDTSYVKHSLGRIVDNYRKLAHNISLMSDKKEKISHLEASILLSHMSKVAKFSGSYKGLIYLYLKFFGKKDARKLRRSLVITTKKLEKLVKHHTKNKTGNYFYEGLARINWNVFFGTFCNLDLPQSGLIILSKYVTKKYAHSRIIDIKLKALRKTAPWVFTKEVEGKNIRYVLNPNVDVSNKKFAKAAASRTEAAYLISQSAWAEFGIPLGSTMLGAAIGGLITGGPIGAAVGALSLTIIGDTAHRMYRTKVLAATEYSQSLRTGLSSYSEHEANTKRKLSYAYSGFNYLGAPLMGIVSGPFLSSLLKGAGKRALHTALNITYNTSIAPMGAPAFQQFSIRALISESTKGFVQLRPRGINYTASLPGLAQAEFGIFAAGSILYGADKYGIIGEKGRIGWPGYVGASIFWGYVGFRAFRLGWSVTEKTAFPTLTGFTERIAKNALLRWTMKAGAYTAAADFFLFDRKYKMLDFNKTIINDDDLKEFNNQFGVDSPIGFAGALAIAIPWIIGDYGLNLSMSMKSMGEAAVAKAVRGSYMRTALGLGMLGIDLYPTKEEREQGHYIGALDNLFGGLGGSLLTNEFAGKLFSLDPKGSLIALTMKIIQEWAILSFSGVPLQAPHPWRLIGVNWESIAMRIFCMVIMSGTGMLGTFPLGNRINGAVQSVLKAKIPLVSSAINWVPSVTGLGNKPYLINQYAKPLTPFKSQSTITLKDGTQMIVLRQGSTFRPGKGVVQINGRKIRIRDIKNKEEHSALHQKISESNYGIDNKGRLGEFQPNSFRLTPLAQDKKMEITLDDKSKLIIVRQKGFGSKKSGIIKLNGKEHKIDDLVKNPHTKENETVLAKLSKNGMVIDKNARLAKYTPNFAGEWRVRFFRKELTTKKLNLLSDNEIAVLRPKLRARGILIKGNRESGYKLVREVYADPNGSKRGLALAREEFKNLSGYEEAYKSPPAPEKGFNIITLANGTYVKVKVWYQEIPSVPIARKPLGGFLPLGRSYKIFRGNPDKPLLGGPGILVNAAVIIPSAFGINQYIFGKTVLDGDKNQALARGLNYTYSQFLSDPWQWSVGYAGAKAQLVGRFGGLIFNLTTQQFIPNYRSTIPAYASTDRYLRMGHYRPSENLIHLGRKSMTSWRLPFSKKAIGSWYYVEPIALKAYHDAERCKADIYKADDPRQAFKKSKACNCLHKRLRKEISREIPNGIFQTKSHKEILLEKQRKEHLRKVKATIDAIKTLYQKAKAGKLNTIDQRLAIAYALSVHQQVLKARAKKKLESREAVRIKIYAQFVEDSKYNSLFSKLPKKILKCKDEWHRFIDERNREEREATQGFFK